MESLDSGVLKRAWSFRGEVPYVDNWIFMRSPILLASVVVTYLVFVLKLGPIFMKNRPALSLNKILLLYNAAQVVFSCYLFFIGSKLLLSKGLVTSSCLMEREDDKYMITTAIHAYFIAKVSELLDTIFFVLRKKFNQVSFLHVYHHTTMIWCTWFTLKYEPGFATIFLGTANSLVHIVMYSYYGLSVFPSLTRYLWWKKYITSMQLVQFAIILLHTAAFYSRSSCPPSYSLLAAISINASLFIYLFGKFYIDSYIKSNKQLSKELNKTKDILKKSM